MAWLNWRRFATDALLVQRFPLFVDARRARAALFGAVALYALSTVLRTPGTEIPLVDNAGYAAIAVAAAVLALVGPLKRRSHRLGWGWLGAGVASWALGEVYWDVFLRARDTVPIPSLSDVCWLAFYPFAFAGLVRLARHGGGRIRATAWLDAVIAALGTAALAAAIMVDALAAATGGDTVSIVVNLAYPLGDVLLLALVVGSAVIDRQTWSRARWVATGGLVAFAVADAGYLFRAARGSYVEGTLLDVGWILGLALLASASWQSDAAPAGRRTPASGGALCAVASVVSMAIVIAGRGGVGRVAFFLAVSCIAASLVRLLLTIREVQRLADSRRIAHTDELTGLGNRRRLTTALADSLDDPSARLALLLIDLDEFKEINDTLGHSIGDQLLVEVGARLRETMRPDDVLTRQGGDEFAVVLRDAGVEAATSAARRLLEHLRSPILLADVSVQIGASIGVALATEHGATPEGLLQHADVAMYQAKTHRTGFAIYTAELDGSHRDSLRTAVELGEGLDRGELAVLYQPVVRVGDATPVSVEALVRWQHPTRGLLTPDEFLPIAERVGLMRRVTETVLTTALTDAAAWRGVGLDIPVAVNLSAADLLDAELPGYIARLLLEHNLPGSSLLLEIVEDALMADLDQIRSTLQSLRKLGVRIAVDDFGTGHSSLGRIWQLPVDELKLDRSFVASMCDDARPRAIVHAAAELAQAFGFVIVAEGVEDDRTWAALAVAGCELAQGWHIARPMPFEAMVDWLDQRVGRAALNA